MGGTKTKTTNDENVDTGNGEVKSEKKNKKEKKSSKDKKEKKKENKEEKKSKKSKKKQSDVGEEKEYDLNLASPLPSSSSRPGIVMMTYDDEINPTPYRTNSFPPPESPGKTKKKKNKDKKSMRSDSDASGGSTIAPTEFDVGPSLSSYISATGGPATWEKPAVVETDCDDEDDDEGETILGSIFKVVESFYDECNTK